MQLINQDFFNYFSATEMDLIITSPPYGIGKEYEKKQTLEQYLDFSEQVIKKLDRNLKDGGVIAYQTGNFITKDSVYPIDSMVFNYFTSLGYLPRNRIIWHFGHGQHAKNKLSGRYEVVSIWSKTKKHTFNLDDVRVPQKYPNKKHYKGPKIGKLSGNPLGKNPSDVWNIGNIKNNHPEKTEHPCQFPELLVEKIVKLYSNVGDGVLYPFMGSGTVGVVCKRLSRHFTGIERDTNYWDIASNRINSCSNV